MFKMTIVLEGKQPNGEQLEGFINESFEGKGLETLKDSLEQSILGICKEHKIHGAFYATATFEENGEYVESDESYVFVDDEYEQVTSFETDLDDNELDKAIALIKALDLDISEIENISISSWNESMFEIGNQEYLVVNEEERENAVTEDIKESLWAFNASFLAQETDYDLLPVFEAMVKADLCEGANEAVLCLVEKYTTLESFVESAVSADGYGHFLSRYDGNEIEQGDYFIYRNN